MNGKTKLGLFDAAYYVVDACADTSLCNDIFTTFLVLTVFLQGPPRGPKVLFCYLCGHEFGSRFSIIVKRKSVLFQSIISNFCIRPFL